MTAPKSAFTSTGGLEIMQAVLTTTVRAVSATPVCGQILVMANPWFPPHNASVLSPQQLTSGASLLPDPPVPPDPPDPTNPLSLARFPPLNSLSPKSLRTPSQTAKPSRPALKSSIPLTATGVASAGSVSDSTVFSGSKISRSGNTVSNTFENFKILPPKNSSPIQTNRALSSSPINPLIKNTIPSPNFSPIPPTRINPTLGSEQNLPSAILPNPTVKNPTAQTPIIKNPISVQNPNPNPLSFASSSFKPHPLSISSSSFVNPFSNSFSALVPDGSLHHEETID
ncbi:unnamed protein product [Eruca vesicaria subsp. sativa]|uniref:Uncharacterized protein n=1 Tax=Eruca vesicaria subsp. sativa TaxID=29727 RepID=A0ABC8J3E0_ERUVS|nr:unnamed protein product [Eruca vesicaria subsp. sativa]